VRYLESVKMSKGAELLEGFARQASLVLERQSIEEIGQPNYTLFNDTSYGGCSGAGWATEVVAINGCIFAIKSDGDGHWTCPIREISYYPMMHILRYKMLMYGASASNAKRISISRQTTKIGSY